MPAGILDTSTLIALERLPDASDLPETPLITAVTLAELAVGPLVAEDESVRIARRTTQAMVHMDHRHRMPLFVQQMHQHHTVHTPTDRHKDRSLCREHAMLLHGALYNVPDHGCKAFSTDMAFN